MKRGVLTHTTGCWLIEIEGGALVRISLKDGSSSCAMDTEIKRHLRAVEQMLDGQISRYPYPIEMMGTIFQKKVWTELARIPYGTTTSYKTLAEKVGSPRAFRAVGTACGANPIAVIIPCHRVLASDGSLGGYAYGLPVKQWLLQHESQNMDCKRVQAA